MGNPADDDKVTINVKGVRKSAWEAAKRGSARAGDSMGTWISDTIDRLVKLEESSVLAPGLATVKNDDFSGNPGEPDGMTPDQVTARMLAEAALFQGKAALLQGIASVKTAGVRTWGQKAVVGMLAVSAVNGMRADG